MSAGRAKPERNVLELFDIDVSSERVDVGEYLMRILARCAAWFEASGASIFLLDEATGKFRVRGQFGIDSVIPEDATILSGIGVAGMCIETGHPTVINDPMSEPMLRDRILAPRSDLASSMVVPLLDLESRCIGVLNLSRKHGKRAFSPAELAVASSLGRHVALAATNASLLATARAAQLETESVLNCVAAAVWVIDSEGRIERQNPASIHVFGEAAGIDWVTATESMPSGLREAMRSAVEAKPEAPVRLTAEDIVTDQAWTITVTRLPDLGAVVSLEDATAFRRASRDFARMKRLAEIGQMTAAIAHEIRNPLTGIRSAAQVIASDPTHAVDFAAIIEEEVLKLNSLCEDFLEFARPLALRLDSVDLRQIATLVAQSMEAEFAKESIRLALELGLHVPIIEADALRIEQVMRNLVRNALQACKPGDLVTISVRPAEFSVSDTGTGMCSETIDKLFTAFFTTKSNGTGLGMSNVRKIVEAHNAEINVDSQKGRGSEFTVRFRGKN